MWLCLLLTLVLFVCVFLDVALVFGEIGECVCFGLFVVGLCLAGGFWSCHCCRLV